MQKLFLLALLVLGLLTLALANPIGPEEEAEDAEQ
jgi:hypothetical protein